MVNRIAVGFFLTLSVLVVELGGGILSSSLALLGDAGHVLSDLVALGLSWYGLKQVERPADYRMTYGYHRVGIFVAFLNAAVLAGVALFLVIEAYRRLNQPHPVTGEVVFIIGFLGLVANLVVMALLKPHTANLNVQSAFWHVLGDILGSVAVIVSGAVIWLTGWYWADSIASLFVAAVITIGSVRIIRRSVSIMLEASPRGIDTTALVRSVYAVPGVRDVHHLHIWALTPEIRALSAHITVDDVLLSQGAAVLARLNEMLEKQFAIGHSTIQLECAECDPHELYCNLGPEGEPALVAHPR